MAFDGRYHIQEVAGHGPVAVVYQAQDARTKRRVALKVLREVYHTDPTIVASFQYEAQTAAILRHPNIVEGYDTDEIDQRHFMVMELVEGSSLRKYLSARKMLAVDRTMIIAHDIALGLGAAHRRGIIHSNIKPQNILIGRDGSIKLTGFSIGRPAQDRHTGPLTVTDMAAGALYAMPELAEYEEALPATDIYALGMVMYEMLTGHPAFNGNTPEERARQHRQDAPPPPSQFNPDVPSVLEELVLRCLEKAPEKRFRDGSQLADALALSGMV